MKTTVLFLSLSLLSFQASAGCSESLVAQFGKWTSSTEAGGAIETKVLNKTRKEVAGLAGKKLTFSLRTGSQTGKTCEYTSIVNGKTWFLKFKQVNQSARIEFTSLFDSAQSSRRDEDDFSSSTFVRSNPNTGSTPSTMKQTYKDVVFNIDYNSYYSCGWLDCTQEINESVALGTVQNITIK